MNASKSKSMIKNNRERQKNIMLTTTYSRIVIVLEQNAAHRMLDTLTDIIQTTISSYKKNYDWEEVNLALKKMLAFNHFCRHRKVETVMIPVVRNSSIQMHRLITELDELGQESLKNIRFLFREQQIDHNLQEICPEKLLELMEQYCRDFSNRLAREELELLPIADSLLSSEDWFCIAIDCMHEEIEGTQIGGKNTIQADQPDCSNVLILH